jgi:hypothetical protein
MTELARELAQLREEFLEMRDDLDEARVVARELLSFYSEERQAWWAYKYPWIRDDW